MNEPWSVFSRNFFLLFSSLIIGLFLGVTGARAGLTVDIHLYHDIYGYYFYPYLSTNTTMPDFPAGDYFIASPQVPTNGSSLIFAATSDSFSECINGDCGGGNYYNTFDSFLYGITNGLWSIWVTNGAGTTLYSFAVTVTGLTSNVFGAPALPIFPMSGNQFVPNQPQFLWSGPAGWEGTLTAQDNFVDTNGYDDYVDSASLSPDQTNWIASVVLPNGTNTFNVDYQSNATAMVIATVPTNNAGQAISGWISTATLESTFVDDQILFTVGQAADPYDVFLVGRYDFEITNSPGLDSSGNGNDSDCFNDGAQEDVPSANAAIGNFARLYFGDTSLCFTSGGAAFPELSNALAGSFTVSAWVNTTNSINDDGANAYYGLPILFLYNSDTNSAIPLSITGSKAAFTIYDQNGNAVTLHSTTTVNDGSYHFLTVTREQSNGLMSLYVDGNLEATGTSTTEPLEIPWIHLAGGYYVSYQGLVDDVRIYSTNLPSSEITTLANGGSQTLAAVLGATNLAWSTSGDASWFVEATNTAPGSVAAAQSGGIVNYQTSVLSATVTGPGTLTFFWSIMADPGSYFDYEFDIDGVYADDIEGSTAWFQEVNPQTGSPYTIPSGQHTLTWTTYADGDSDSTEAGFLDQVLFASPQTSSVSADITLDIYREQDPAFGDIYIAFPSFNSVTPPGAGTTTNTVESPNGRFSCHTDSGGASSGSAILFSFDDLANELTNGLWTLYINKGLQTERQFHFSVSANGLTTNLLSAVEIITPTNGATGVPPNANFQWIGPTNYSSLNVSKQNADGSDNVNTVLALTATNWPSPPTLDAGTNRFDVSYASNSDPNITFTIPVDTVDSQVVANWNAVANLHATAESLFLVVSGPPPASLLSPRKVGANLQFSFVSQSNFTYSIEYRTNLIAGLNWQSYSNFMGDGTLKTIVIPFSIFNPSKQGFVRVQTQ